MRAKLSPRDYEQISAYLDGQLSSTDRARLEERMRQRPEIKDALEEMGRTRALLRMAPRRHAPRNFTLTRAMVEKTRPQPRRSSFNLFPVLSFTSALAMLALVFTLVFEFSPYFTPASQANAPLTTAYSAPTSDAAAARNGVAQAPAADPTQAAGQPAAKAADSAAGATALGSGDPANSAPPPVICCAAPGSQIANSPGNIPNSPAMGGAWGMGGGGGGAAPQGVPPGMGGDASGTGGVPGGSLVLPENSTESLPQGAAPAESARQPSAENLPPVTGSGPILGAAAPDKYGSYLNSLPTPMPTDTRPAPTPEPSATPVNFAAPQQPVQQTYVDTPPAVSPTLWMTQIALGAVALLTALGAFIVWWRSR